MAENADDPSLYWIEPEQRGVIPLDGFHLPRRLARTVRTDRYKVYIDRDFAAVLDGCAAPGKDRARTWINTRIRSLYTRLHEIGHCHSVEVYDGEKLVGGLYGVRLGRAFFGESMFHLERDASKIALVHLVARLRAGGFSLLDTQFVTDHLNLARSRLRGGIITSCSRPRSRTTPISARCRSTVRSAAKRFQIRLVVIPGSRLGAPRNFKGLN